MITIAAENHIAQAQHYLALIYEYGIPPITQDFQKAALYYQQAADQKYLESMYNLGLMYAYGRGQPQDFRRAKSLFEAAARYNHAPSVYYMGLFKYHGYGESFKPTEEEMKYGLDIDHDNNPETIDSNVNFQKRDYQMALNWFEKAAALDDERVSEKAATIAKEIRELLSQAEAVNEGIIKQYQSMSER